MTDESKKPRNDGIRIRKLNIAPGGHALPAMMKSLKPGEPTNREHYDILYMPQLGMYRVVRIRPEMANETLLIPREWAYAEMDE